MVKKNLAVAESRRAQDAEALKRAERLAKLKARKEALDAQIAASHASISKLRTQISTTNTEIATVDKNNKELQRKIDEQDAKSVLFEAYEKQVSHINSDLHHYHSCISQCLTSLQSSVQPSSKQDGESHQHGSEKTTEKLEKEEMALFSELYAQICDHLSSQVDNASLLTVSMVKRLKIPSDLEQRLIDFCARPGSVGSLLTRLAILSKAETEQLEVNTETVDVASLEEAALSRLESEGLSQLGNSSQLSSTSLSISSPRRTSQQQRAKLPKFPTVDELLEQQRSEHVTRFLDTEKSLNSAHALQTQRDTLLEDGDRRDTFLELVRQLESSSNLAEIRDSLLPNSASKSENSDPNLNASFSSLNSDYKVDLHAKLQNFELLVCSEETACEASTLVVEKLKETKRRLERDLKGLKDKFQRIQQLDVENRERQELCTELVRMNASMKPIFESQSSALKNFVDKNLVEAQREHLQHLTEEGETGSLSSGVMAHEMTSLLQMTMISSSPQEKDVSALVSHFVQHLDLMAHQSVDNLVSTVLRGLESAEEARNVQMARKASLDAAMASFAQWNDDGAVSKLKSMTEQLGHQQKETWLPLLDQSVQQVSKAVSHCDAIQQLCSDYIQQPAQLLAPWLKLDGQNFDSTIKNWKSLSHSLRQHQKDVKR